MVKIFVFLILFLSSSNIFSEAESWKNGVLVTKNGKAIFGEVAEFSDYFFIRNRNIGNQFLKVQISGFIDEPYYRKIKESNPWDAVNQSIFLFGSGADYQFIPEAERSKKDLIARSIKIPLLLASLYFLNQAEIQRKRTADSILFLNYDQKQHAFEQNRNAFYISAGVFLLVTLYYAFDSWSSFGKDSKGNDLGIRNSTEVSLEKFLKEEPKHLPQASNNMEGFLQFGFSF
ncbi:hypothetical protein EHR05_13585 [Leptospira licerasiae]|nr:hypothetical protein EHR05_13585 [Leptospira licerasiae]